LSLVPWQCIDMLMCACEGEGGHTLHKQVRAQAIARSDNGMDARITDSSEVVHGHFFEKKSSIKLGLTQS
jgi:hypothetical protein